MLLGAIQDDLVSVGVGGVDVRVIVHKVAEIANLANPIVNVGKRDEPCPNRVVGAHPQGGLDRLDYPPCVNHDDRCASVTGLRLVNSGQGKHLVNRLDEIRREIGGFDPPRLIGLAGSLNLAVECPSDHA